MRACEEYLGVFVHLAKWNTDENGDDDDDYAGGCGGGGDYDDKILVNVATYVIPG